MIAISFDSKNTPLSVLSCICGEVLGSSRSNNISLYISIYDTLMMNCLSGVYIMIKIELIYTFAILLKISFADKNNIPGFSGVPCIVYVLPEDVCP